MPEFCVQQSDRTKDAKSIQGPTCEAAIWSTLPIVNLLPPHKEVGLKEKFTFNNFVLKCTLVSKPPFVQKLYILVGSVKRLNY